MSKLGIHVISWNQSQPILDFVSQAQPVAFKMLDFNDMDTDAARASSPNTLFIGRMYVDNQPLDNPPANAQDFFNQLQPAIQKMGNRINVWEGYNEVAINSVDDAQRYNDFTVAWAQLMHNAGLKCAAYSFSTGNPDFQYWQYLADGARACDYLALHEYDAPRMDAHPGAMCLRYRQVRALLPPDAQRPILITECGIDDGAGGGWQKYTSGDDYLAQLAWYDGELMQDDYVAGATVFTVDGKDWKYFELLPILTPLANYIATHPTPSPTGQPTITAVTFSPTTLNGGQLLNVSLTVRNDSTTTLQTQGPDPGFVYTEGDTFLTRGFAEQPGAIRLGVDFDGRSGIDHPYRWGLGAPLAPGQSTVVTGAIRLNAAQSRNYWVGLVRERVVWLQDHQGTQKITVNAPPPPSGQPTITAVTFSPTTLNAGQVLNVSITVINNSNATLPTEGPNPDFVYTEGDTFLTRGFAEQRGAYRVGLDFDRRSKTTIDHPYRWGLGAPLAPGQSVSINGAIQLNTAQAQNYWAGLVQELIAWQQDNQGKQLITVNPAPTGQPTITAVTFSPTTLNGGQLLNVSLTVRNDSTTTLQTQGPDPGFVYTEGDTFLTRGFAEQPGAIRLGVDFDGRSGIDHPYRWGLGAPLAPGQSTVVTGAIRLNAAQSRNYWVGLVRERVVWLQDNQGTQKITVV
jgi:hypothetical protein